jgi:hypothetical protein
MTQTRRLLPNRFSTAVTKVATVSLARLPDEERKQWESLWCDVDSLLHRVSGAE